jgi:hypothetical protein
MKVCAFEADKKIALGVSCNNNTEEELTRSLDPWVDRVDYIIAIEGRYRVPYSPAMMKGPIPPKFGTNTLDILEKHYGGRDGKLLYSEVYAEQYKKRQKYLDVAAEYDFDVVIVWDSDDIIMEGPQHNDTKLYHFEWARFFKLIALAHEFADGEAGLMDMWAWIPSEADWPRQYNNIPSDVWHRFHRIHLNPGKQKYILNHYTMAANKGVTEEQVLSFSTNKDNVTKLNPYLLFPYRAAEGVRFTTDRKLRTDDANKFGDTWSWQAMQEELYRAYLVEIKVREGGEKLYKDLYREPFTYYFDERGRPINYTKEEQERFQELEL